LVLWIAFLSISCSFAFAERCSICGEEMTGDTVYLVTDKITQEKVRTCNNCVRAAERCSMCGLPAGKNPLKLSDGRYLCERDSKTAVVEPLEIKRICQEAREEMDKLFSRFTAFPTNVHLAAVDRINLLALFKIPGNDYECPNILGYFRAVTNHEERAYEIRVLSAMRAPELKETCAHEQTHAWVFENVPAQRKLTLARDAEEGFCELVGYLLMEAESNEEMTRQLLKNEYTHGQIQLFVEAEKRFGLNEIIEWMKYGADPELDASNLENVRRLDIPRPETARTRWAAIESAPAPDKLLLKGILWSKARALALINNQSFAPGETGKVSVGKTNVSIRCVAIRENSAVIQMLESGEQMELSLGKPGN
jgi:hypothetical protein